MTEKAGNEAGIDKRVARLPADLRAQMRKIWHPGEWEALSREERRHLARWILELIESDVREAMEAKTFGARGEEHTSRTVSLVDERGWREINQIQDDALMAILTVKSESAERLDERGADGIMVLSAMLSCELATQPKQQPPAARPISG